MSHSEIHIPTSLIRAAYTEWRNRDMLIGVVRELTARHQDIRQAIEAERRAWRDLERIIPVRTGWYRLGDSLVGWAKRDAGGLQLTIEPAMSNRNDRRKIVEERRESVRHILGARRGGTRS